MSLNVTSAAVLIGYDSAGTCVYSDFLDLGDYYDGEHAWDVAEGRRQLRLCRLKGYLFDEAGILTQEFESFFDPGTGVSQRGSARRADGTVQSDPPAA